MDDPITAVLIAITFIFGSIVGFIAGNYNQEKAILECQKELPRNVNCTIIAVPVDKN